MKAYFHQNHNPDAKDLKQLAQETGLTKRVLQVWFQNARAKYRRGRAQQDKSGSQALTKSTGNDVTKPMCESVVAPDSNCSYSITSSIGTSPGSDSYLYDVSSSCEDLRDGKMSPNPNYHSQPLSNQASPLYHQIPYSDAQYMGSTTSLQSIPTTPTLSSTLKSVQAAITSPCSM
uniref:Homeobox domain-containing protein n=1 Tax=Ciona savignyi TaxID=51511 RepID=H2Z1L2_CIOSA